MRAKKISIILRNLFSFFEPSPWVQTWEQAIEETDATSDNGDEHLQALLQSQLNTPRSLDEQKDFEEALLVWLAEKPPVLTLSYQLAKNLTSAGING